MRKSRRLGVIAAASGLLAAGGITVGLVATASANTAGLCSSTTTCTTGAETVNGPASITAAVSMESGSSQDAVVTWNVTCSPGGTAQTGTSTSQAVPFSVNMTLGVTNPNNCTVSATMTTTEPATNPGTVLLVINWTPAASASPTATATTAPSSGGLIVKGYKSKCVDDSGNKSTLRNKIIIWSCNNSDKAQLWHFASNGELQHNGKCANDQATGGNGSHVILYTCNGAANEVWSHLANGEYKLKARGGTVCLDDPASSTKNGTQLIVWTCKDSANQRWYQP
ncbi:MAG: ricin-type beta-trefoil lectin domain protein [Streptosporangiaceae bacterium]